MPFDRELEEVTAELQGRTSVLEDRWRGSKVVDRLLAAQRLLQGGRLTAGQAGQLEELNLNVQRLWTDLRRHRKHARDAHDQLRILALEAELARAERDRDVFLDAEQLVEELFCCAETFLVERLVPGVETFRDLVRRRDQLAAVASARAPAALPPDTTQKIAVVYSLTGEQIHSAAA